MSPAELEQLVEGSDLEVKLAAERDGQGELPVSFFESYAAFANSQGDVVLLGVQELPDGWLKAKGVAEPAKILHALWA